MDGFLSPIRIESLRIMMKKITAAILSLTGLLLAAVLFSYFYVNVTRVSEYLSEAQALED